MHTSRREFIAMAGAASCLGCAGLKAGALRPSFGYCGAFDEERAKILKEIGYEYQEGSVGAILKPNATDEEWKKLKERICSHPLPFRGCNGFIPRTFRLSGEETTSDAALEYAVKACNRADEVGLEWIVFGSGAARRAPDGFSSEKALAQYASFCGRLAERIAGNRVTIVLEPLQKSECNVFNYVWQGLEIVRKVNSPRIRQLADFYHMMRGDEGAESVVKAGSLLRHCHIAEKKERSFPSDPEEFLPYFKALKRIGYAHRISTECRWPKEKTQRPAAWKKAFECMNECWRMA